MGTAVPILCFIAFVFDSRFGQAEKRLCRQDVVPIGSSRSSAFGALDQILVGLQNPRSFSPIFFYSSLLRHKLYGDGSHSITARSLGPTCNLPYSVFGYTSIVLVRH